MHNLFLFALSKISPQSIVFKGGTSLMICYNLDRFSEDLDFNIIKDINIEELLKEIMKFFEKTGYQAQFSLKRKTNTSQNYSIYIKGPLYMGKPESQTTIELNFSHKDDIFLNYFPKKVNHVFDDFPQFYINTLSLEEIFAEKIRCILTREKARDVYDFLYLINRRINLDINLVNKKLMFYNMEYDEKTFLEAVKRKEKIWNKELNNLIIHLPSFEEVETEIKEYIKKV
ncbi:MAG: nucleotidyl transferase AbiEii/AbiGii toxin family protein [archaeon]